MSNPSFNSIPVPTASHDRVAWLTNFAPPYRIPLWELISQHVDLDVWLLERATKVRTDGSNRGIDWAPDTNPAFQFTELSALKVRRGEARHYVTWWMPRSRFAEIDLLVVGGWDSPAYWTASNAAKRAGIRRVGFYESHALSRKHTKGPLHRLRVRFFMGLDAIVVPGIAARDALLADGIPASRIWVGFNAVDARGIWAKTRLERLNSEPRATASRLLFVGQLIERKNVDSLIRAMALPRMGAFTLTVVGVGPELDRLTMLARELDVSGRVEFSGAVLNEELPAIFAEHDILVMPSHSEVWGLVVNEALSAGLSCVVSETAGVAPSIAEMDGVRVAGVTPSAISTGILHLADSFRGAIDEPAILIHDPAAFGHVFLDAFANQRAEADPAS